MNPMHGDVEMNERNGDAEGDKVKNMKTRYSTTWAKDRTAIQQEFGEELTSKYFAKIKEMEQAEAACNLALKRAHAMHEFDLEKLDQSEHSFSGTVRHMYVNFKKVNNVATPTITWGVQMYANIRINSFVHTYIHMRICI